MTNTKKQTSSEKLRDVINMAILGKKGMDLVNLDMRELYNPVADFFIICHASNPIQMQAIADEVRKVSREVLGEKLISSEGQKEASEWMLLDYFDVVVHIFSEEARNRYKLEAIWGDAVITRFDETGKVI